MEAMKWIYKTEGIGHWLCFDVNAIKLKIHIRKQPDPHLISFSNLTDDLPCCRVNRWERLPRLTVYEIIVDENLKREHNRCNKWIQKERNIPYSYHCTPLLHTTQGFFRSTWVKSLSSQIWLIITWWSIFISFLNPDTVINFIIQWI